MTRAEKIEFNRLVEIINDTQEMFAWLDEYRKRKNKADKRALFAARDYENILRKKIIAEVNKHDNQTLITEPTKTKAA